MRRRRLSVRTVLVATVAALAAGGVGIATGASQADEKPVTLTVSDGSTRRVRVTLGQSGISQGDVAPRSDGARRYAVYGETARLTQP